MTGSVVIDFKGDRIMDYLVWHLASDSDQFIGYMKIPLTQAGRNTTACVEWLVKPHLHNFAYLARSTYLSADLCFTTDSFFLLFFLFAA